MRFYLLAVLSCAGCLSILAQPTPWTQMNRKPLDSVLVTAAQLDQYESRKIEVATAFLRAAIVPGGGHFYLGEQASGIMYLAGEGALAFLTITAINEGNPAGLQIFFLTIVRLVEFYDLADIVSDQNRELRRSLGIGEYSPVSGSRLLTLVFRFSLAVRIGGQSMNGGLIVTALAIYALLCCAVFAYADNRGRSGFGFFLLSFFLSPLVGIIIAMLLGPNQAAVDNAALQAGTSKKCPYCKEIIKADAVVCRFCGRDI